MKNIIKYFEYEHLPPHLQDVSAELCDLAKKIHKNENLKDLDEKAEGLRKLLEAKDCFVRSAL